ncbi:hypothetical protein EDM68_04280 [Candidatus Uhrbacteria bacterium]|nr:MAG: hypothetical protein EDM68_04280 [Candidatus Uhrbacteria bacterium]
MNNQEVRYPGFLKFAELGVVSALGVAYGARLLSKAFDRAASQDEPAPRDCRRLTLLVPGFLGPRGSMLPLERFLRSHRFTVRTVGLGWRSVRSLTDARTDLKQGIRGACARLRRLESVDLICHGMSAVAAYDLLEEGCLRSYDLRLVALGAPFRGTSAAYLPGLVSGTAAELTPSKRNGVRHRAPPLNQDIFLSLAGEHDLIVPYRSSWHGLALNEVRPVDRLGLLEDPRIHWRIAEFLRP